MFLLVVEALFAGLIVAGIGFMWWPAALIVAGVMGLVACERAAANRVEGRG